MNLWVLAAVAYYCIFTTRSGNRSFAMIARLREENGRLRRVLEQIATPPECGCSPCRGDCQSDAAKAIFYDEMVEVAALALWEIDGGAQKKGASE